MTITSSYCHTNRGPWGLFLGAGGPSFRENSQKEKREKRLYSVVGTLIKSNNNRGKEKKREKKGKKEEKERLYMIIML